MPSRAGLRSRAGQKTAPERLEWKKSASCSSWAASCALDFDLLPDWALRRGRNSSCRGNAGGSKKKKLEFTDLVKTACLSEGKGSLGQEEDAFPLRQICCRPTPVSGSGALLVRNPAGPAGEQVPLLFPVPAFLSLLGRPELSGAGAGCQGQLQRGRHSAPSQGRRARAAPLLHPQQLAGDQPQLVSALFGSTGHNFREA